ncbi:hypothetical protein [Streptomyces sp. NPDC058330]|uniref:hypothetical protein n=1 Tax=Streptomyces sp. NPDC058330 TaxID=3346449 RepID=UPI0036EF8B6D
MFQERITTFPGLAGEALHHLPLITHRPGATDGEQRRGDALLYNLDLAPLPALADRAGSLFYPALEDFAAR